jgi:hypothetical protein
MAIGITFKSSVYQTNNTQSTFTGSPTWTPAANSLLVCFVCTAYSSSPSDPTGVSGHGVAYSKLTLGTSTLSTTHKLSIWVAKAGASPTSAAPVASVTSTNGTGDLLIEFEVTGHDDSGTALQAIVDSTATNNGTGTSATVTLASPASAANRAMTFVVQQSNNAPTTAGSWTLSANASGNFNTPATGAAALFRTDAFDTAGAATTQNVAWRMVGIEIKADPNVSVALTGQSSASSAGTLTPTMELALTGQASTTSAGTMGVGLALTGQSVAASAGTLTTSITYPQLYYVIGASAGWTDPTAAEIKAGQLSGGGAATESGNEDSPTSSTTYDFLADATGLTASTAYKIAFVWSDGTNDSNVDVGSFTTGSAGGDVDVALTGLSVTVSGGAATPTISVEITGQSSTSAAGTVTPAIDLALTGAAATASAGTVTPAVEQALSGQSAAASAGTVTPAVEQALAGQEAAASAGSVGVSLALAGQEATASAGTATPNVAVALTGAEVTVAAGTLTPAVAQALAGQSAAASGGTATPEVSVALAGEEVAAQHGTLSPDNAESAALTGEEVTASAGTLTPDVSIALSGQQVAAAAGTISPVLSVALSGAAATTAAGSVTPTVAQDLTGAQAASATGALTPAVDVPLAGEEVAAEAGTLVVQNENDVTIALTGLSISVDAGSLAVEMSARLQGIEVAATAGSITPAVSQAMTGASAQCDAGTIAYILHTPLSRYHAALLEALARAHGLIDPLTVTAAGKSDGTLIQDFTGGVLTTTAAPSGYDDGDGLSAQERDWLETLARAHGILAPLTVTTTGRTDGTFDQSIAVAGDTATYTRLS